MIERVVVELLRCVALEVIKVSRVADPLVVAEQVRQAGSVSDVGSLRGI